MCTPFLKYHLYKSKNKSQKHKNKCIQMRLIKNEYIDFVNKFKLCKFTFQKENI